MDYTTMSEPPTPRALPQDPVVREDGGLESLRLRWKGLGAEALNALEVRGLKLIDEEKFEEAGNAFRDALAGFSHLVGPAGDGTVRLLKQLGKFYIKQDNLDKAETLYIKSISDHQALFGEIHYRTLLSLQRLGEYYCSVNQTHDSAIIYNRIVLYFENLEETARKETSDLALYAALHLSNYYQDEKQFEPGLNLVLRMLSIFETLSDQDSCTHLKKEVLVAYKSKLPLTERVDRILLEALDIYEKAKSPFFLNLLYYTATRYYFHDYTEKLTKLLDRIVCVVNKANGKEVEPSSEVQLQLWRLEQIIVFTYSEQGNLQQSAWWNSHLRESVEAERGIQSEEAIWALMFAGALRSKEGRWDDAEPQFKEALRRADIVFGPDSPVKAQISKCLEKDTKSYRLEDWMFHKLPNGRGEMLKFLGERSLHHRSF